YHHLVGNAQSESLRQFGVEDIFTPAHLDFQIMVAGAQSADLFVPSLDCLLAYLGGVRAAYLAKFFRTLQVLLPAIPVLNAPPGALFDHGPELVMREFYGSAAAHPG